MKLTAIAAVVAFLAGWAVNGWRLDAGYQAEKRAAQAELKAYKDAVTALVQQDHERNTTADRAYLKHRQEIASYADTVDSQGRSLRTALTDLGRVFHRPCPDGGGVAAPAQPAGLPDGPAAQQADVPDRVEELARLLGDQSQRADAVAAYAWSCYEWAQGLKQRTLPAAP